MLESRTYSDLFVESPLGEQVLNELVGLFYDRPSYTRNDPNHTMYLEGQRSVVEFILRKTTQFNQIEE